MKPPAEFPGRRLICLSAIVLFACSVRFYKIDLPIMDFHAPRQIQTAEITRNLYRASHNVFYPQVGFLGPEPRPFILEFPLYNAVVALLYGVTGGVDESLGRVTSILCWMVAGFFLYAIAKRFFNPETALAALFFFHLSRLGILASRSFQPEAMMTMLALGSFYFFDRWVEEDRKSLVVCAGILGGLALLVKLPIIHIALPMAYLLALRKERLKRRALWAVVGAVMIAVYLWYWHAARVGSTMRAEIGGNWTLENWFQPSLLASREFYDRLYVTWRSVVLGSIGFALFLLGILMRVGDRRRMVFHVWLGAVILYMLFFNYHAMTHLYYHVPAIAVGSVFAARAFSAIPAFTEPLMTRGWVLQSLVAVAVIVTTMEYAAQHAYRIPPEMSRIQEAARAASDIAGPDDVIVTQNLMVNYWADRRGWWISPLDKDPISRLEEFRSRGARLFVKYDPEAFPQQRDLSQHVRTLYPSLKETPEYAIFDLGSQQ
jgi:4-amino-4-deoxy-L-arabinose transferase-like glycosyltransferase